MTKSPTSLIHSFIHSLHPLWVACPDLCTPPWVLWAHVYLLQDKAHIRYAPKSSLSAFSPATSYSPCSLKLRVVLLHPHHDPLPQCPMHLPCHTPHITSHVCCLLCWSSGWVRTQPSSVWVTLCPMLSTGPGTPQQGNPY